MNLQKSIISILSIVVLFPHFLEAQTNKKPNIVWIVAEDLSPYIAAFGDSTVHTPNLDWLAKEGICFDHFYSAAPVCAPARSSLALGMYPTHVGTNHMRTGGWYAGRIPEEKLEQVQKENREKGRREFYEAVPQVGVKMFSEYMREQGYYCTNNSKEDYQFVKPVTAWDESSNKAHWRNRKEGQPFFSMITLMVTHESQIWARAKLPLEVDENLAVPVPPYLPDTEVGRKDIRRMYSNIVTMDQQVGEIINQLKEDGELENTIIIWFTDHGGPLPRQKRLLYDSGLKVPLIVRYPDKSGAGTRDDRMVSFIDMAPTTLSLAGIKPPDNMDGKAFLGKYTNSNERKYLFAASDRFDESTDAARAGFDKEFKYIKYFMPEKPMFLHVNYRDQMDIMQELYRLKKEGKLSPEQALWFRETKPVEELFELKNDPHELKSLADNPLYRKKLLELRKQTAQWMKEMEDKNIIPENELVEQFWPKGIQPQTQNPEYTIEGDLIRIHNLSPGASIGYKWMEEEGDPGENNWQVYTKPIKIEKGKILYILAHRIGHKPSEYIKLSL